MFSTCLFCHTDLGANDTVAECPVGQRLAFDAAKGRLWVVCTHCGRWNLTPIEERWEPIERCEQLFQDTWQRYTVENVGLARTKSRLELVRIGAALPPEIASWRYGARLQRWARSAEPARGVLKRSGGRYLAPQTRRIARGRRDRRRPQRLGRAPAQHDAPRQRDPRARHGRAKPAHRDSLRPSRQGRTHPAGPQHSMAAQRDARRRSVDARRRFGIAHRGQAARRAELRRGEQCRSAMGDLETRRRKRSVGILHADRVAGHANGMGTKLHPQKRPTTGRRSRPLRPSLNGWHCDSPIEIIRSARGHGGTGSERLRCRSTGCRQSQPAGARRFGGERGCRAARANIAANSMSCGKRGARRRKSRRSPMKHVFGWGARRIQAAVLFAVARRGVRDGLH